MKSAIGHRLLAVFEVAAVSLVTTGLVAAGLSGCSASNGAASSTSSATRTVTVATSNDAPFSVVDQQTNIFTGIDGDMLTAIAKLEGWNLKGYVSDFSTLIPAIQANKADLVVDAMYVTDARKQQVDFSDPWYNEPETIVVKKDNTSITDKNSLAGLTVGFTTGTVFTDIVKNIATKEVKYYDNQASLIQGVLNGQIDAAVTDSALVAYSLKQNPNQNIKMVSPYTPVFPGVIAAAARKGDTTLLSELNDGLKKLKSSGEYTQILQRYGLDSSHEEK